MRVPCQCYCTYFGWWIHNPSRHYMFRLMNETLFGRLLAFSSQNGFGSGEYPALIKELFVFVCYKWARSQWSQYFWFHTDSVSFREARTKTRHAKQNRARNHPSEDVACLGMEEGRRESKKGRRWWRMASDNTKERGGSTGEVRIRCMHRTRSPHLDEAIPPSHCHPVS